jgi:hypothetical protein
MTVGKRHSASYRDPDGFVFEYREKIYRQVNQRYAANYTLLKNSGLYSQLIEESKLLPHTEIDECIAENINWYKTLLPKQVTFISYPYEWCFSQWKDAALLTLYILKISIHHSMILKDATPFNIQFVDGGPIWIDTLSFEKYDTTKPWIAYRQFVECFIAPLLLSHYQSQNLLKIFQVFPDGIPLETLVKFLPVKSRFNLNILLHVVLPSSLAKGLKTENKIIPEFNKQKLLHIVDNLIGFVQSIKLPKMKAGWNNYYEETVLSTAYVEEKSKILTKWIHQLPVNSVLDLGSNTGNFAQIAVEAGKHTIAVDSDIDCIERLYNTCKQKKIFNLLPLCIDISNPTPSIGWDNNERAAFYTRVRTDLCIVLALIHHLAVGKNVGFVQMAETFSKLAPWLIIEFIPKSDPKVSLLLKHRTDIFENYNEFAFVNAFEEIFSIEKRELLSTTGRILFLMKRKQNKTEF